MARAEEALVDERANLATVLALPETSKEREKRRHLKSKDLQTTRLILLENRVVREIRRPGTGCIQDVLAGALSVTVPGHSWGGVILGFYQTGLWSRLMAQQTETLRFIPMHI